MGRGQTGVYCQTMVAKRQIDTTMCIDHIPPADVAGAIAECYRLLPANSRLVVVSWCSYKRMKKGINRFGPEYFHNETDIRRALDDAGFCFYDSKTSFDNGEIYLLELVTDKI